MVSEFGVRISLMEMTPKALIKRVDTWEENQKTQEKLIEKIQEKIISVAAKQSVLSRWSKNKNLEETEPALQDEEQEDLFVPIAPVSPPVVVVSSFGKQRRSHG